MERLYREERVPSSDILNDREKQALRLLIEGHDAKSIARELNLSVHTVNERLRSSRRKLGVSSSREAARLLAVSEQSDPKSLVNKAFVVGEETSATEVAQSGGRVSTRTVALTIGGTLIMSIILAAAILAWASPAKVGLDRPPVWRTAPVLPNEQVVVMNLIDLEGNRLSWNGRVISEAHVSQFLEITTRMEPQPLLVLRHSAQTKPERVEYVRGLIEDVVQCTPDNCLEVTLPAGK